MFAAAWFFALAGLFQVPAPPARTPWHHTLDLSTGETVTVQLRDGSRAAVRVVEWGETLDSLRGARREVRVRVMVNGERAELVCGNYRLPVKVGGAQVDCPASHGLALNSTEDSWGLEKDVRLRIWPGDSPWIDPATFRYPARQKWFASGTQMSNEPVHVDGGEVPATKRIYYHSGLDIGGAEGLVDVIAATSGLVVSSGTERLPGHENTPVAPRYDVVYVLDDRGWYYRYSHLKTIDPRVVPGAKIAMGQPIGVLGKEGASGGWSHLHFEIRSRQPSGKWGTEDAYAFLWQSYVAEFKPAVIAVARPHQFAALGELVALDGARSWSASGAPLRHEWFLSNGTAESGARVLRRYDYPGTYSEILKVTTRTGQVAYDFASVQVIDPKAPAALPPTIQAAYAPTMNIKAGDLVTFKTRTFRTTDGSETWDFGDGSAPVTVKSDGNANVHDPSGFAVTEHRFVKAGHYVVRVSRTNAQGFTATAHVWVHVGAK